MGKKAAKTGSGPAAVVAIEQEFPAGTRLIDDELAGRIRPRDPPPPLFRSNTEGSQKAFEWRAISDEFSRNRSISDGINSKISDFGGMLGRRKRTSLAEPRDGPRWLM